MTKTTPNELPLLNEEGNQALIEIENNPLEILEEENRKGTNRALWIAFASGIIFAAGLALTTLGDPVLNRLGWGILISSSTVGLCGWARVFNGREFESQIEEVKERCNSQRVNQQQKQITEEGASQKDSSLPSATIWSPTHLALDNDNKRGKIVSAVGL